MEIHIDLTKAFTQSTYTHDNLSTSIHTSKFGSLVDSILNSTTQCWWHQLEHLIWRNSHYCDIFKASSSSHNSTWNGESIQGSSARKLWSTKPLTNLQRTTNTTWITCCAIVYKNGATQCSTFIKQKGPTIAPCIFGQLYN
jgi:hypothetical protein